MSDYTIVFTKKDGSIGKCEVGAYNWLTFMYGEVGEAADMWPLKKITWNGQVVPNDKTKLKDYFHDVTDVYVGVNDLPAPCNPAAAPQPQPQMNMNVQMQMPQMGMPQMNVPCPNMNM